MRLRRLPWAARSLAARSAVAGARLSARSPARRWALTGERFGTAIMVIGAGIISIIGVTAAAGYARQADGRIRCRIDIAISGLKPPKESP